ncbi:MAG TPA: hypothetical protein VM389_03035 [Phycisphaerae bacterium]|nr:hypothetical protein [Phycisphaerae bacterium]HUU59296.1 hypothetical protein [Phycisphaerae bacterium]
MRKPRNLLEDVPEDLKDALDEIDEELEDIEDEAAEADNMGDRERAEMAREKIREARRILRGTP